MQKYDDVLTISNLLFSAKIKDSYFLRPFVMRNLQTDITEFSNVLNSFIMNKKRELEFIKVFIEQKYNNPNVIILADKNVFVPAVEIFGHNQVIELPLNGFGGLFLSKPIESFFYDIENKYVTVSEVVNYIENSININTSFLGETE